MKLLSAVKKADSNFYFGESIANKRSLRYNTIVFSIIHTQRFLGGRQNGKD